MTEHLFPDGEIPEEILKRLRENTFINFKESFFRGVGPIPTMKPENATYPCNSGIFETESIKGTAREPEGWKGETFGDFNVTGYQENGVFRSITFKYANHFDENFVKEYEKAEAEEKRRRFINEIVGVAINPVTARKWLEPGFRVGDGETDGTLFNKPAIFRNYIPYDVLCLTFSNGSVQMIKIVEVIYG